MSYRGKVRNVRWCRIERESFDDHWRSDVHPTYESYILADLYDSPNNRIDEDMYVDITDDVLEYYDRERITWNLVNEVRDALHNVWIDYYYDDYDDEDYLDGSLDDYI